MGQNGMYVSGRLSVHYRMLLLWAVKSFRYAESPLVTSDKYHYISLITFFLQM